MFVKFDSYLKPCRASIKIHENSHTLLKSGIGLHLHFHIS